MPQLSANSETGDERRGSMRHIPYKPMGEREDSAQSYSLSTHPGRLVHTVTPRTHPGRLVHTVTHPGIPTMGGIYHCYPPGYTHHGRHIHHCYTPLREAKREAYTPWYTPLREAKREAYTPLPHPSGRLRGRYIHLYTPSGKLRGWYIPYYTPQGG